MPRSTVLIAELHSANLSNRKIGYLLPQYGGQERDEATVRRWAHGVQPKADDWDALKALYAAVFPVKHTAETPQEVVQEMN